MDSIRLRPYEFKDVTSENTSTSRFSNVWVHFVELFYSRKKERIVCKAGEYFLSFWKNVWYLAIGRDEKNNLLTGFYFFTLSNKMFYINVFVGKVQSVVFDRIFLQTFLLRYR